MARPSLINTVSAPGTGGATVTVPNVIAGDTLIIFGTSVYAANAPTVAVAGSGGAGGAGALSALGAALGNGGGEANQRMSAWRCEATGATGSRVVTLTGTNESGVAVAHLRNAAATLNVSDRTVARNQNPTAAQTLAAVAAQADAIVLCAWAGIQFTGPQSWAATSPAVEQTEAPHSSGTTSLMVSADFLAASGVTTTGTRTATGTPAPASGFAGKLVAIAGGTASVVAPTVDAGADAAITVGATFARTATEAGGAPTSRGWTIVSGPAGVGTSIGTAAALSWTPSTAGTYVLRYTAANSAGTATDDVTVTVQAAAAAGPVRINESRNPDLSNADASPWYGPDGSPGRVSGVTGMDRTTGYSALAGGSVTARWPVTAGTRYTSSVQVKPGYSGPLTVGIDWYDAAAYLSSTSVTVQVANGAVVRVGATGVAPAGAVEAVTPLDNAGGPAVFTAHLVEAGTANVGSYFDGASPGATWDGAAGASTSRRARAPRLVETLRGNDLTGPGTSTTATFTPAPGETIVAKAIAGHTTITVGAVTGGGLTWAERVAASEPSYTPERLFTARAGDNPAPMTVSVTFTGSGTTAPTLIVERWADAALAVTPATVVARGVATAGSPAGTPDASIVTTVAGSVVTWLAGDWTPVTSGTPAYRSGAVATSTRRTAQLNAWAAWQAAPSAGTQQVGMTAPTGQKWQLIGVELLYSDAPPTPTVTTAAERFAWGTPLPASDEFAYTGAPDPAKWAAYNGPGHAGNGVRSPAQNTVQDGYLRIAGTAGGATGGLAHRLDQQYGRWECRVRMGAVTPGSAGEAYHGVLIIWPTSERWPEDGEYDWLEIEDVEQDRVAGYLHLPHPGPVPPNAVEQVYVEGPAIDLSEWQNYAFEWSGGRLKGYVNGNLWFDLDGAQTASNGRRLDSMPGGHLTIQLDNFTGTSGLQPAYMDVEWARVYAAPDTVGAPGYGDGRSSATLGQANTGRRSTTAPKVTQGVRAGQQGTGTTTRRGDGRTGITGQASARPGPVVRSGRGSAGISLAGDGAGRAGARSASGRAGLVLDEAGRAGELTRRSAGVATVALDEAAAGRPGPRTGDGVSAAALDAAGRGTPDPREARGTASVTPAAVGSGRRTTRGASTTGAVLDEAATGTGTRAATGSPGDIDATAAGTPGVVHRRGAATAAVALDEDGAGRAIRARGYTGVTVDQAGAGRATRATTGTPGAVAHNATSAGVAVRTGRGTTAAAFAATSTAGPATRTGRGTAALHLDEDTLGDPGPRTGTAAAALDVALDGGGQRAVTGRAVEGLALDEHTVGDTDRGGAGTDTVPLAGHGRGDTDRAGAAATTVALGAAGSADRRVLGHGTSRLSLAGQGGGHRDTTGAAASTSRLDVDGTGTTARRGDGATAAALGQYGEHTTRAGHGSTAAALDDAGRGYRVAHGTGSAAAALDARGGGTRRARGGGDGDLTTGTAPRTQHARRRGTSHPVEPARVLLGGGGVGARTARGRGTTGIALDEAAATAVTVRAGHAGARILTTATGDGEAAPRAGHGHTRAALRAAGSAERRVRGHGSSRGPVLGARPRRPVPGRASTGATGRAGLYPTHTQGGLDAR